MVITIGTLVYDSEGNKYEVTELVSDKGGFGSVYKILRENSGRTAALKTISADVLDSKGQMTLQNEASLALGISHENVIRYDYFHDGTTYDDLPPYIIMEYADGGDLRGHIETRQDKSNFYDMGELNILLRQLAAGMKQVNAVLIHRDLKPENILISDGVPKITDFGLAKAAEEQTRSKTFKGGGTWPYMAPEAWEFGENSFLMDMYGMGVVFYELAALRRPFATRRGSYEEWRSVHLTQAAERPSLHNSALPSLLDQLILKMMGKKPSDRYSSWDEVVSALDKGDTATGSMRPATSRILKRVTDKHVASQKSQSAESEKKRLKQEYRDRIVLQFRQRVIAPLEDLCKQLNTQSQLGRFTVEPASLEDVLEVSVLYKRGDIFTANLEILHADEHAIEKQSQFPLSERKTSFTVYELPKFDGRDVLAWGIARTASGIGFNLLLLANAGELYGDWLTLHNTNDGFNTSRQRHPEPFAFELGEIEREMHLVQAMHIFRTSVLPLTEEMFADLIAAAI